MTICIIIATRNAGKELPNCLDSILNQDLLPTSIIVQDGASNDNTVAILRSYEQKLGAILNWRSEPDCGIADAWNKALKRVKGDWILFLGADDRLFGPNTLSHAEKVLGRQPAKLRIAYGDVIMLTQDGAHLERIGQDWDTVSHAFRLSRHCLQHQAVFHHHSYFDDYGAFDTSLRICADQEMLLRGLLNEDAVYVQGFTVALMAVGGLSTQRKYAALINQELLTIQAGRRAVPPWDQLHWKLIKAYAIHALFALGGEKLALKGTNLYRTLLRAKPPLRY